MNISQLFKAANNFLSKSDLVPVADLKNKEYKESLEKKWNTKFPNMSDIEEGIKYLGRNEKYFFASSNPLRQFYYKKDHILIEIPSWNIDILETFEVNRRIEVNEEEFKRCIEEKRFETLFYVIINESIRFTVFEELFDLIPDENKYDIFMGIYTTSEYGFSQLNSDFVKKVFSYRTKKIKDGVINKLTHSTDEEGFITIYRGTGGESTSIEKSFSWTLSFYTAVFFASRFDVQGNVYSAKVHIDNVVDFINGRGESEIITEYSSLVEVEDMEMYILEDIIDDLSFSGNLDVYHEAAIQIKEQYFNDPSSIHGVLHCKRVLLLAIILGQLDDVSESDLKILIKAAQFHDIGRINDIEDEEHGKLSIKKMKKLKIFRDNKTEKDQILKYIIENHCINDEEAISNISNYRINDKDHAIYLLKLFKDADGLDRVRLKDLDAKYLRNNDAKKLAIVAFLMKGHLK